MPFSYDPTPPNHKYPRPKQEARKHTHSQTSYNSPRDLLSEILEEEAREQEALKQMPPAKPYQPSPGTGEPPRFSQKSPPINRLYGNRSTPSEPPSQVQNTTINTATTNITNTTQSMHPSIETVLLLHPTLRIPVSVKSNLIDSFIKQGYQPIGSKDNKATN